MRATILLRGEPLLQAALERHAQLTLDPTPAQQRALRRASKIATTDFARRQEARRAAAITALGPAARAAGRRTRGLVRALVRMGGRVGRIDSLADTITAVVPRRSLLPLVRRPEVQAVEPAPEMRPLSLPGPGDYTNNLGAGTWWAAGHTGGRGASDGNPANLAIIDDAIREDHPALAGIDFELPTGSSPPTDPGQTYHGTALTSVAVSQGASGCSLCVAGDADAKGIAPGVNRVLDARASDSAAWALGLTYTGYDSVAGQWYTEPGAADPAHVWNYSRGGTNITVDDDVNAQSWDSTVDAYGVTATVAAGNDGPTPQTIDDPGIAYNVISVGGFDGEYSADPTDDSMFSFSSVGPTVGGRKKPDLVAAGDNQVAYSYFDTANQLWRYDTGTSYAAPQVAGVALLLAGAGITDPKTVKAILIDSARAGRSSASAAMGTQTSWEPDWGWGELDATTAYNERLNFAAGTVPASGARFFRATAQNAGDRATLVWNRRVTPCWTQGCAYDPTSSWHIYTLTNLDLAEYDAATGAQQAASTSAVDNVEQVRAPASGQTIYKVTAGGIAGLSSEPFSLAATNALTPLVTPQPTVTVDASDAGPLRAGQTVTVTATVANPSPDLTAGNAQAALDLPPGTTLVAGAQTQDLGTLAEQGSPGSTATATWTIRGDSDGVKPLAVAASATAYGSTLQSTGTTQVTVDATAPAATIAAPAGMTADPALALSWGCGDRGSITYDVEVSTDGAPFVPWLTATTQTAATFAGAGGNRYAFRVRATDALGNVSAWVVSSDVTVVSPPGGDPWPVTPPAIPSAHLALHAVKRRGTSIVVTGTIARAARAPVTLTWSARTRHRTYRIHKRVRPKHGRFRVALRLPRSARSLKRGVLVLTYTGDSRTRAETRRLTVTLS